MEEVFSYIIGLGAAVMMPIIFTILGVCIGIYNPQIEMFARFKMKSSFHKTKRII